MAKAKTTKAKVSGKGATKGGKRARAKQLEVPGTERVQDAGIRAAIERLRDAKAELADARKEEDVAAEQLIALMARKKLGTYVDEQLHVRVDVASGSARVKLKSTAKKGKGGKGAASMSEAEA